jgi:hypothetical protein
MMKAGMQVRNEPAFNKMTILQKHFAMRDGFENVLIQATEIALFEKLFLVFSFDFSQGPHPIRGPYFANTT